MNLNYYNYCMILFYKIITIFKIFIEYIYVVYLSIYVTTKIQMIS